MLVPSMTNEEITKEVFKDYRKIVQSHNRRLMEAYHKERKRLKINKRETWAKDFTLKLPASQNQWTVIVQKPSYKPVYKDLEDLEGCALTHYYGPQGLRIFRPTDTLVEVFNGHFFTRYNERMKLNLHRQADVIKRFFLISGNVQPETVKHDDKEYVMSLCKEGAALGRYQEMTPLRWLVHNTFITHEQIHQKQAEKQTEKFTEAMEDFTKLLISPAGKSPVEMLQKAQRVLNHVLLRA